MLLSDIWKLQGSTRQEQALLEELQQNPPLFKSIVLRDSDNTLELLVSDDYLFLEGIRVSLLPVTAQKVADHFNCILPTKNLVDKIWRSCDVKLSPKTVGTNRGSFETLKAHSEEIDKQLNGRSFNLLGGHKKDIVINKRIPKGKVIIYGWHYLDGRPIQPETSVHGDFYKDYSHGTRLISRTVVLNGKNKDIWEVINSEVWEKLVGDKRFSETKYVAQ
jgi:hypothetical protein